jgi:hypothetical protein
MCVVCSVTFFATYHLPGHPCFCIFFPTFTTNLYITKLTSLDEN